MRVGIVDALGSLHSVAWVVQREGHEVRYWIKNRKADKIGRGLVNRIDSLDDVISWKPDVVISCGVSVKEQDIPFVGSTPESIRLESDRIFAGQMASRWRVGKVPHTVRFPNLKHVLRFLDESKTKNRWVVKAEDLEVSTLTTHVTEDEEHLREVLEYESNRGMHTFMLQEFIDGVEVGIEGWYDYRHGWIEPINSTLECKRLMPGDLGPTMDCMGSIVWPWSASRPKLFRQTLENLTPYLNRINYTGPISGNFIVSYKDRQPYFLKFTPRIGWNTFECLMSDMSGSVGEFFVTLSRGDAKKIRLRDKFMAAVVLCVPNASDVPLSAPLEDPRILPEHVWSDNDKLRSVHIADKGEFITPVLSVTGTGTTVRSAISEVYEEVIPHIKASNLLYRNDVGEKALRDIDLLQSWGYIVDTDK